MISNLTDQQVNLQHESETIRWKLMKKEGDAKQIEDRIAVIEEDLKEVNQKVRKTEERGRRTVAKARRIEINVCRRKTGIYHQKNLS